MIRETMTFITDEVNKYLSQKLGSTTDPRLVLGNIARVADDTANTNLTNRAILSLVNIEEDRVSKVQENFTRQVEGIQYKSPPVFLNLYILIAVNLNTYADSMRWLACIIQFFQMRHVFTPITHPNLDSRIQKIIIDLFNMNFEQINHLWSTLGGKYLPSVLYKVRQIAVDEDMLDAEGGFIKEIQLDEVSMTTK